MSRSNMHKKMVKFGHVALEISKQTDKQTDRRTHTDTDCSTLQFAPPRWGAQLKRVCRLAAKTDSSC